MTHPILSQTPIQATQNPLDAFDPNNRDAGAPAWATYCPARSPVFKTHKARGFGVNALSNWRYGVIYELAEGRWVERARTNQPKFMTTRCDDCSTSLMTKPESLYDPASSAYVETGRMLNAGRQKFVHRSGKLATPLEVRTVCDNCARAPIY